MQAIILILKCLAMGLRVKKLMGMLCNQAYVPDAHGTIFSKACKGEYIGKTFMMNRGP